MKPQPFLAPLLAPLVLLLSLPLAERTLTTAGSPSGACVGVADERAALRVLADCLRNGADKSVLRVTWTEGERERPFRREAIYNAAARRLTTSVEGVTVVEQDIPPAAFLAADAAPWAASFSGVTGFAYRLRRGETSARTGATGP
jgi:hypothetical protein